jgi:hypothetical protein
MIQNLITASWLFICCILFNSQLLNAQVVDSSSKPVEVVLYDSISYDSYNPDTFHHTKEGLLGGFRKSKSERPLVIRRFGSSQNSTTNHLAIYFYEYTPKRVRMAVFYVSEGKRHKIGYFSKKLTIDLPADAAPTWLIEQVSAQLFEKLHERFPDEFPVSEKSEKQP